ncbi:anti sigma factor C-terminal domain-containing protein [Tissierella sp. Yu-01]|uniref:anti sigma factor C-terminal domain-containing protein n=1 Tax=Tissierella sp. Yu-01 TaxID=3035694 RepID=UPI00240E7ED4|nr:anti sigma factor C-terminal domain-containing protein [Tissierella sp. Yu-01]WFA09033.1 anti sigma factor C-terminal domain-containing protein [Tissierella sp. Yu-01]
MNFKELMSKYKKGETSEEEKLLVEKELEKYEAIEEYLADIIDFDFNTSFRKDEEYRDESIEIKKSVNNRLRKVVLTSVGIMIALLLGIFFIISPLIDSLYYNPGKVTVGEVEQDINFDMQAITELNYPGFALSSLVNVDRQGLGEYDIYYFRTNLFTEEINYVNSKLKRRNYITNHTSWINDKSFNFKTVRIPDWFNVEDSKEQKERVMNHVKKLSPVAYTSSWITFEKDLTMEELHQLQLKYRDINFVWVGVRIASPDDDTAWDLLGFITRPSIKATFDKPNVEKYPALDFMEWLVNPVGLDHEATYPEPRGYELHFKDLLKYAIDRKDAINVLEGRPNRHEYYEKALNYVEENGVKSYGVLIYANAEDLIKLVQNEQILTLELNQVMASKRYID